MDESEHAVKVGAGILFCCDGEALLLLRSSKHNDDTLGLPGGNIDAGETLTEASIREAKEELGCLPEAYDVKGHILTKRGKNDAKHYTVFIAALSPGIRENWMNSMTLNHEHIAATWVPYERLFASSDGFVEAELRSRGNLTVKIVEERKELHPVCKKLVQKHASELRALIH